MLLNTEELLALVHGDAEPDRLADLLDRLEHCPDSAAALQVLVSLRVNREEALEALRLAAEKDATSTPIPHPSARRNAPSTGWGWATQGLRLAASIALVAVISVWAATTFFGSDDVSTDAPSLASTVYLNKVGAMVPQGAELTSDSSELLQDAVDALEAQDFATAKRLLESHPGDASGRVVLFLGMSEYFLHDYEAALATFSKVRALPGVTDSGILHQAAWYEGNALLALDQPLNALSVLEKVKTTNGYPFQDEAAETYDKLARVLGINTADRHD